MTPVRWVGVGCLVLAVVAVLIGPRAWRAYQRGVTVPPTTPLAEQCDEVPAGAERTTLTGRDGTVLGAAVVGPEDAEVGVVLRQGASQRICDWLPWAAELAEATGARVLLFDRRGRGSSPADGDLSAEPGDLGAAVERLREDGADRVGLVASSMGNSVMFAALPDLSPPPCVVASVSPVLVSSDDKGTVDGSGLEALPRNTWVTWESQNAGIVTSAQAIQSRARALGHPPPHALEVDTSHHSRQLVLNHPEVAEFLRDAVASCSPGR